MHTLHLLPVNVASYSIIYACFLCSATLALEQALPINLGPNDLDQAYQ